MPGGEDLDDDDDDDKDNDEDLDTAVILSLMCSLTLSPVSSSVVEEGGKVDVGMLCLLSSR